MTATAENLPPGREVVSFLVGGQEFCIDIGQVREIRGWAPVTTLPHAQDFVLGVMNLRGAVVPTYDLSARLGLGPNPPGPRHVVIIVALGDRLAGLLVSAVSRMQEVEDGAIQPFPQIGQPEGGRFVAGLIPTDEGMLRLIDLEQLLPKPASHVPQGGTPA